MCASVCRRQSPESLQMYSLPSFRHHSLPAESSPGADVAWAVLAAAQMCASLPAAVPGPLKRSHSAEQRAAPLSSAAQGRRGA